MALPPGGAAGERAGAAGGGAGGGVAGLGGDPTGEAAVGVGGGEERRRWERNILDNRSERLGRSLETMDGATW